jgi:hypothetical protein
MVENIKLWSGGMTQMGEHLLSKCTALSLKKNKGREGKKKRREGGREEGKEERKMNFFHVFLHRLQEI